MTDSFWLSLSISAIVLIPVYWFWLYWKLTFWRRQNISQSLMHAVSLWTSPTNLADEEIARRLGKVVGYYEMTSPSLILSDPKLIHDVLIKNFKKFSDHRKWLPDEHEANISLFNLSYNRWMPMRRLLGQVFTGANLKKMMPLIDQTLNNFFNHLDKKLETSDEFDMNQFIVGATLDVGTRCIFGMAIDSLDSSGPDAAVVNNFRRLFTYDMGLLQLFALLYPNFAGKFGVVVWDKDALDFISRMARKYYNQRMTITNGQVESEVKEVKNFQRRDLLQMMIDARSEEDHKLKLTTDEITSNCAIFSVALFDPISTSLIGSIYNLAKNPDVQEIVSREIRKEFDDVAIRNVTEKFETLNSLKQLDAFYNESLRMTPPVARIERKATEDCHLTTEDGKQIYIPKDTMVIIPPYVVHHDPDNYDKPEEFRLNRFYPENKSLTHKPGKCTFVPFSDGPRNCIGRNFGYLVAKILLAKMLAKYKFTKTEKTRFDLHTGRLMIVPKEMVVRVEKRI